MHHYKLLNHSRPPGVVEGTRWALLNTPTAPGPLILVSGIVSLGILLSGAFYFRRMERTFADVV